MFIDLKSNEKVQDYLEGEKISVVKFATATCPPCNMLKPIFEGLAEKDSMKGVNFIAADANSHPQAYEYGVSSVPALYFFRGTEVLGQNVGFVPEEPLEAFIVKLINGEEV